MHPPTLYLIARSLSAAAGVMTIWTVHRLGTSLFDRTTAVIGGFFLSIAFLHVRDSHFGVTDVAATWLATMSFLFTVECARTRSRRHAIFSGVWAGLAASTKYNVALVGLPALWVSVTNGEHRADGRVTRSRLLALYCGVAAAAFLVGTPYALLDIPSFISSLASIGERLERGHAAMAGYGWGVHLTSSLRYGLGVPLLAAGLGGLAVYCWQDWRAGFRFTLFPVVYFVMKRTGGVCPLHHPGLTVSLPRSRSFFVQTAGSFTRTFDRPQSAPFVAWSLAALLGLASVWSTIWIDRLLARPDNRLLAADWIRVQFPEGITIYQSGDCAYPIRSPGHRDRAHASISPGHGRIRVLTIP